MLHHTIRIPQKQPHDDKTNDDLYCFVRKKPRIVPDPSELTLAARARSRSSVVSKLWVELRLRIERLVRVDGALVALVSIGGGRFFRRVPWATTSAPRA